VLIISAYPPHVHLPDRPERLASKCQCVSTRPFQVSVPVSQSCRLLKRPLDHSPKLLKLDTLPHRCAPGLIFLIQRNLHRLPILVHLPSTHLLDEIPELATGKVEPFLQHLPLHLLHALAHDHGDAHTHYLLEALHIGDEVGVEVIPFKRLPEGRVARVGEVGVQDAQVLDSFG